MADPNRVLVYPSAQAASVAAARRIIEAVRRKPDLVMCVASGASPLDAYQELGRVCQGWPDLFRALRLVKLDEWGGLPMDDSATCDAYVRKHLIVPLGVSEDRYIGFESDPADPAAECARVSEALRRWGGVDLCVLGIGLNGHLGLNEPGASLAAGCHAADLSETAQTHSMLTAAGAAPRYGLSLGMGDLLQSREILLLALGSSKREPLLRTWSSGVSTDFPASFLTLHSNVSVMTDLQFAPGDLDGAEIHVVVGDRG